MKRGLKVQDQMLDQDLVRCYNRYPDEKGTERGKTTHRGVTTVTPMKRGLKDFIFFSTCLVYGYNRYPDEKGTESATMEIINGMCLRVTTVTPMKRGLKVRSVQELLQPLPR